MEGERWRVVAAFSPFVLSGCESIIGADFGSAKLAPSASACELAAAPRRPASLAAATDKIDFTVVIHDLELGDEAKDAGAPTAVGYDLDGLCSGPDGPRSCKPYSWLDSFVVDGPGGRDDAIGNLFGAQMSVFGVTLISSTTENAGVAAGKLAPTGVLRVHGYSGFGADDQVVVELFQVAAFAAGQFPDAGASRRPSFDATDAWPPLRAMLTEPDAGGALRSVQRDEKAFVYGGQLVAHFASLALPVSNVFVQVEDAVITGEVLQLQPSRDYTLSTGTIAGKIRTDAMLAFLPLATGAGLGLSFCTDDQANYGAAKRFVCASADLPETAGNANGPCVFTSFGETFHGSPASLGAPIDVAPPVSMCSPETDPASDQCARPTPR